MTEERKPTGQLKWIDGNGRPCMRPVNYTLDIRDFQGRAAFALLAIAANRHLGTSDLLRLLNTFMVERSRSYIQRRRWMVNPAKSNPGSKPNADRLGNVACDVGDDLFKHHTPFYRRSNLRGEGTRME